MSEAKPTSALALKIVFKKPLYDELTQQLNILKYAQTKVPDRTFHNFRSLKFRRSTFLNHNKLVDRRILGLKKCEMFGQVVLGSTYYFFAVEVAALFYVSKTQSTKPMERHLFWVQGIVFNPSRKHLLTQCMVQFPFSFFSWRK